MRDRRNVDGRKKPMHSENLDKNEQHSNSTFNFQKETNICLDTKLTSEIAQYFAKKSYQKVRNASGCKHAISYFHCVSCFDRNYVPSFNFKCQNDFKGGTPGISLWFLPLSYGKSNMVDISTA